MRIQLTDGSGKWFSKETAQYFREAVRIDDQNDFVSKATDHKFYHQGLYYTKGGRFILKSWSDFRGDTSEYKEISKKEAAVWFSTNEHDPHPECEKEFSELEIK